MTRLSRDQQFTASFNDFMVFMQNEYPNLKKWSTYCTTKNKSSSVHEYTLHIPKQTILYTIDAHTNGVTGQQVESEVVMEDQDVPDTDTLHLFSNDYFLDFDLVKLGKVLSSTNITHIKIDGKGDLNAIIQVKYYRSHLPYPTSDQQLKAQCAFLEAGIKVSNGAVLIRDKEIRQLKRQLNTNRVDSVLKMRETVHKMQAKIRECYKELNKAEECPVCYECIKSEELMVPACCHNICDGCFDRCDTCPICREEYV